MTVIITAIAAVLIMTVPATYGQMTPTTATTTMAAITRPQQPQQTTSERDMLLEQAFAGLMDGARDPMTPSRRLYDLYDHLAGYVADEQGAGRTVTVRLPTLGEVTETHARAIVEWIERRRGKNLRLDQYYHGLVELEELWKKNEAGR